MNYPTNLEEKTLNVKMAISPLQWGECPGNLRFTLFTASATMPIGSISIGGMAAYKLQKLIQANGHMEATVLRGNVSNQFVLTHLQTENGNQPWKDAVFANKPAARKIVEKTVELPASRANVRVTATTTARSRISELVEVEI